MEVFTPLCRVIQWLEEDQPTSYMEGKPRDFSAETFITRRTLEARSLLSAGAEL